MPKVIANKDTYHIKYLEVPEGPCPSNNTLSPMVELIILHNMIQDHLGYCIAHSNCNWNLILPNIEGQNYYFNTLATDAASTSERGGHRGAKVVMLQGGKYEIIKSEYSDDKQKLYNSQPFHTSPDALNSLFTDMKHIMKLETLALRLPMEFSAWPDLSGLQHLHLEISGCQSWKLDTILLRSVSSLKYFEIDSTTGDTRILHDDCMAIANLLSCSNTLDWLCFSNNFNPLVVDSISPITQAMAINQSLPLLGLVLQCHCKFTNTATRDLSKLIQISSTLKHLKIGWCTFGVREFFTLYRLAYHKSQLEGSFHNISLEVDGDDETQLFAQLLTDYHDDIILNRIIFTNIHDESVKFIATILAERCELRSSCFIVHTLTMTGNHFTNDGLFSLVKTLRDVRSLTTLDLSANHISNDGIVGLAQALCPTCVLVQLKLSNKSISDEGAVILAENLTRNYGLSVLDLSSNNIADQGTVAIAKHLHLLSSLTKLDLSNNNITDEGAAALAQVSHSYLKVLNLSANHSVGEQGTHQLVQALSTNRFRSWNLKHSNELLVLPEKCKMYVDNSCTIMQYITFK